MNLDTYALISGTDAYSYEFWSEGPKGKILKMVVFQSTLIPLLYNLAFGDFNLQKRILDDRSISDNGDHRKVLATVVSALFDFTNRFPNAWIYAEGSTPTRTRLYQIEINRNLEEVLHNFEIQGKHQTGWEPFSTNRNYIAFLAKRKFNTFEQ